MPSPSAPTESRPTAADTDPSPGPPGARRSPALGLSAPQVAGSALAAVSAAVAASWLGVAGTVIGAALGSLFGTVGSALYAHSLATGRDVVRRTVRTSRDGHSVTVGPRPGPRAVLAGAADLPWRRLLLGSAAVLVVALGALTVAEQLTGRPISGYTAGDGSSGTTLGRVLDDSAGRSAEPRDALTPATDPAPATPEDGTNPTDPADQADPGDQAEPADPADPTGQAEPTEQDPAPAQPSEPAEASESADPTQEPTGSPTDPTPAPSDATP